MEVSGREKRRWKRMFLTGVALPAFQEISTGGHNDLRRASDMARAMVAEYGMSDAIGPVATGAREPVPFLQTPVQQSEPLAEETAREIDVEVKSRGVGRDRSSAVGT